MKISLNQLALSIHHFDRELDGANATKTALKKLDFSTNLSWTGSKEFKLFGYATKKKLKSNHPMFFLSYIPTLSDKVGTGLRVWRTPLLNTLTHKCFCWMWATSSTEASEGTWPVIKTNAFPRRLCVHVAHVASEDLSGPRPRQLIIVEHVLITNVAYQWILWHSRWCGDQTEGSLCAEDWLAPKKTRLLRLKVVKAENDRVTARPNAFLLVLCI